MNKARSHTPRRRSPMKGCIAILRLKQRQPLSETYTMFYDENLLTFCPSFHRFFEVTADVTDLTKADFLQRVGEKTPIFVRSSTVTLGREFPDEARNPRGFAIKHYTREGNYDIVGLNFPVFFCRDPIQGTQYSIVNVSTCADTYTQVPMSSAAKLAGLIIFFSIATPPLICSLTPQKAITLA